MILGAFSFSVRTFLFTFVTDFVYWYSSMCIAACRCVYAYRIEGAWPTLNKKIEDSPETFQHVGVRNGEIWRQVSNSEERV